MATLATGRSGVALVLASWCWLAAAPARAQWVPNGVPLCTADGEQSRPRIVSDGLGGAIVCWSDSRDYDADPYGNHDVYAQRVTAEGVIPEGWPADGVAVCTDSTNQFGPNLAPDNAGGAYVIWQDWRNLAANRTDIYLQRVTAEGTIAPGWTVNGIPVCTAPGDQWVPQLAPDGAGGVFVVWEDFRRTGSASDRSQVDLYAQHITPQGTIAPGWPLDGLPVRTAAGGAGCANVLPDGVGGLFIEWCDARNFELSQADIYALRITGEGSVAPGWVADGVPICSAPGFQNNASLAADGQGGFIVAWLDARAAAADDPLPPYDIYAQRVTASGSTAAGWPVNGAPVCTAPDLQQDHHVVSDGAGGALMCWSDFRNRNESASDLYAQRIQASGEIAPGWPVDGVALSRHPGFELASAMVPDGAGGALVAFEGNEFYLFVQHVTASGAIAPGWDPDGAPLCTFQSQSPAAVSDGNMGMIVAWEDGRSFQSGTAYDIYAQRVVADFPTPTLVALVRVEAEPGRVLLRWSAGSMSAVATQVYRRSEGSEWMALGGVREDGGLWVFEDRSVDAGRYAYRLSYRNGQGEIFTPEEWVSVPSGYVLALAGFYPNPVAGEPRISLSLGSSQPATLRVFDTSGRAVVTKELDSLGPGKHVVPAGSRLAAGIYWLRLTQGGRSLTARGVVVR